MENRLLLAARRMFFAEGYDAFAMERLATAVGVSKATLYARYAGKPELFRAVVADCVRDWSERAARRDHLLTEDISERLYHHGLTIARSLVDPEVRALNRLMFATGDRFAEVSRAIYEMGYLHIVQILARDIEDAAARDARPVRDAMGVARHLTSAIGGWYQQESSWREVAPAEVEAFADRVVELLLAARAAW